MMERWVVLCALLLFSVTHYGRAQQPPVIGTPEVIVAFKGDNPSFTFSFNQTTYGPDAKFYTSNSQRSITEKIPGQADITHTLPSTFDSVILGNFTWEDPMRNTTTNVYTATFITPLLNGSDSTGGELATLEAQLFLFENATTYNFTVPHHPTKNDTTSNNTIYFSTSLSGSSLLIFTRVKNWRFRDPRESLQVKGSVKASSGPLAVSFSKYGDPTNNLKSVVLRGGIDAVVVRLINNATLYCRGRVATAYVDISYSVTSYTSPIGADIYFTFPSFFDAFGNETQQLCGVTTKNQEREKNAEAENREEEDEEENYIEYYVYMTLDSEDNPVSWILVGMIAAGGALVFCCLVTMFLVVRWQYNRILARKDDEETKKEEEAKAKERKEEEEAERKLLENEQKQGGTAYKQGYYDYLLKKPIEEIGNDSINIGDEEEEEEKRGDKKKKRTKEKERAKYIV